MLFFLAWNSCWGQEQAKWHPGHYALYMDRAFVEVPQSHAQYRELTERFERFVAALPDEIIGVQGPAYWGMLEPDKDRYDFSLVEEQLRIASKYGKRLFFTLSEKSFVEKRKPTPAYLESDPVYGGGVIRFENSRGSQARIWNPAVLERFNRLVVALGKRFDREPNFEGIEFVETALNVNLAQDKSSAAEYLDALKTRLIVAKKAFPLSVVLQETNWFPGHDQRRMMEDFFKFCFETGVGIGGPDLIPDAERAAERPRIPAYEFYPRYAGRMPLAADVQVPQYTGRMGDKKLGKLTASGIYDMGVNTLKLNYIFWAAYDTKDANFIFSKEVIPLLKEVHGRINENRPEKVGRR